MDLRSVVPWLLGWFVVSLVVAVFWARLKWPERRLRDQRRMLKYGGVIQRRPLFVAGATPKEAAETLVTDPRFFGRTVSTGGNW